MNVFQLSRQFKAQLLAREKAAALVMLRHYHSVYASIQAQAEALAFKIDAEIKAGRPVSQSWLFRERRLQDLLAQTKAQMAQFGAYAGSAIKRAKYEEAIKAQQEAHALARAALGKHAQIAAAWNQLPTGAIESIVGTFQPGSPVTALFDSFGPIAAEAVKKAFVGGVATGQGPRTIARTIRDALGEPLTRALTISRTETIRAYREASIASYAENDDVVEKWRWTATKSSRTCAMCLAMDGEEFDLSVSFGSHPNCFVSGTIVDTPQVIGSASRWYEGEIVDIETISGNRLSVTPNHPVLTSEGWIAAGLLHEGGNVIRSVGTERILATINPDHKNVPARIEEVAEAFRRSSGVSVVSVPTSAEDFHGDGKGSDVSIVGSYRQLRNTVYSACRKPFAQKQFVGGDSKALGLPGLSTFDLFYQGMFASDDRSMGSVSVSSILFGGAGLHHEAVSVCTCPDCNSVRFQSKPDHVTRDAQRLRDSVLRFARRIPGNYFVIRNRPGRRIISQGDSAGNQNAANHFVGDTVTASELLARFTGLVAVDQIVKIGRRPFSGHVHNLHTSEGWYIANNIIAHNCRCVPVPVTKSWDALGVMGIEETRPTIESGADWFERQSAAEQEKILGPVKFELFERGDLRISDLVGYRDDPTWGPVRYERSVKSLAEG